MFLKGNRFVTWATQPSGWTSGVSQGGTRLQALQLNEDGAMWSPHSTAVSVAVLRVSRPQLRG